MAGSSSTEGGGRAGSSASGAAASRDEVFAARLSDPSVDLNVKLRAAQDIRDEVSREGYSASADYVRFVEVLLPVLIAQLREGIPCSQWTCAPEVRQRLQSEGPSKHPHGVEALQSGYRHLLLEALHRLPQHEPLKPHAADLMALLLRIMENDNEEHAIIALKIVIELHRNYKESIGSTSAAFLDLVKSVYGNMQEVIASTFGDENGDGASSPDGGDEQSASNAAAAAAADAGTPGSNAAQTPGAQAQTTPGAGPLSARTLNQQQQGGPDQPIRKIPLGMRSLKLLAECPIAVVFLFQSYREIVPTELRVFVPLVFDFLDLQAAPQARAHAMAAERGETYIGVVPVLNARRPQFTELIVAQVKTMSFVAYFLRMSAAALQQYRTNIPQLVVRLLKDCPAEGANHRKELLIAARHILQTDFRNAFVPHIDTLVDDRVLIGLGITSHEQLRPLAYSMIADLVHHVREELNITTLSHVVHIYSCNLHDPTLAPSIQTMCSKLLLNLTENVVKTEDGEAAAVLNRSMEAFVSKIEAVAACRDDWKRWSRPAGMTAKKMRQLEKEKKAAEKAKAEEGKKPGVDGKKGEQQKGDVKEPASAVQREDVDMQDADGSVSAQEEDAEDPLDEVDVERSKPIAQSTAMVDTATDLLRDTRFLLRNLIFAIKTTMHGLKHVRAPMPNSEIAGRLFVAITKCMIAFDLRSDGGKEHREVMETFSSILLSVDPLVFLEVLETNMPFFLQELLKNQELLAIPQTLLADQNTSQIFVGIAFRFLVSKLDDLGHGDAEFDSIILRLYKMSFMAVTIFPETNEPVLQPHLSHIIMHSLKLASKAPEPGCYYLLLRVLFRSIGGGRFELLYKEVIPLLEVLLTNLNNLLLAATDRSKRDLFVELCLTVPVRLSVLLPFLSHLMKPLVLSLQAGPDLVSQGLRTLELCVDNLTPEFLNPLLAPIQQEMNTALWRLLRPLPFNHHHAHTTVRILGKIGGRNRKNLGPAVVHWKNVTDHATAPLSFDGKKKDIPIANIVDLGLRMIKRGDLHYRRNAYAVLKHASVVFVKDSLASGEQEQTFADVLRGLFEACRIEEFQQDATRYLRNLALFIFSTEIARQVPEDAVNKLALALSSAFLDGMIESLACVQHTDITRLSNQIVDILQDLLQHCKETPPPRDDLPAALLAQFAMRLGSLCYDHSWQRKSGGALGIMLLVKRLDLGQKWLIQHEGEFLRSLIFMLKDVPTDAPGNVQDVVDTALHTIRLCHDPAHGDEHKEERDKAQKHIIGFLIVELASQVEIVRTTTQAALRLFAELSGQTIEGLIAPVKSRLFSPIFTKPLRALAFPMQIGHMDGIAFCMTIDPPLLKLETDKEQPTPPQPQDGQPPQPPPQREPDSPLERLLTEALGIADADDQALIGPKPTHHASSTQLTKLRVVCVRLLSAAMSSADFLNTRHTSMRNRILQVYFKLLYAKSSEVVEAAYECLKVPVQQGKLPKDLLQTGLRPVLVNLGDHKRLTVDSLQGLARLLELLPNYFKVEIGQKLLDHFKALADPGNLPLAALAPQSDNGTMNVMAAIINVFHLLPYPGAGSFLQDVCTSVVEVERRLKKATTSPFTTPLAKFVSRYAPEAASLFSQQLREEPWSTTLRALILSEHGKPFRDHIAEHATNFFAPSFAEETVGSSAALHAVKAIQALIKVRPSWIVENDDVINRLVSRWTSSMRRQRLSAEGETHLAQVREDAVFLSIFISYLQQTETQLGTDLLFRMTDAFIYRSPCDSSSLARFLFRHVAQSRNISFRQTILRRFIDFFANDGILPAHKTMALRYIINPLLLVAFSRGESESAISDPDYMNIVHGRIWQPWLHNDNEAGVSEDALRIEGLYMATLIVRYRHAVMTDCRKDVIKLGWSYMKTPDPTTKTAAHFLIAQFLAVYDSKPKILMPIYTTLLRSHQVEARHLVKEALNVLVPELPARCPTTDNGLHPWIRATRHIMTEDGHSSMSQLTHIFQIIIRFPDVFYERRDLFVPSMVTSLPKLCLLSTATPESRSLCIDLIELMVNWDKQRLKLAKEEEAGKMDLDGNTQAADEEAGSRPNPSPKRMSSIAPSTTSQSSGYHAFTVPSPMRDSILNGALIRFIASTPEPVSRGGIVKRSLDLLKHLFTVWPDVNVKFAFLQRVLAETDTQDQHLVMICNTVDVLSTVISVKSDDWIKENVAALHRVAERGISQQDARLHVAYKDVLKRILGILPSAADRDLPGNEALKALEEWATNFINDGIRAMTNLHGSITLIEAWAAATPNAVDQFMSPVVRVITSLAKEHLSAQGPPAVQEMHLHMLRSCLDLCRTRMAHTGDGRRWVLSALCTLVEKSPSVDFCRFILDLAANWVLVDHREAFPTNKEKATLLGKMMVFENRPDESLLREFLQVILKVYSDPQLARSEYTVRLEQPFLLGCRNRDPGLRCKFMEVFDQAIVHTLHGRLNYIFGIQNWESLADTNWMHQALDLLLGAIEKDTSLLSESAAEAVSQAGEAFRVELAGYTAGGFIDAARKLLYSDPDTTHQAWITIFKEAWTSLPRNSQIETTRYLIGLLTKEYHLQNVDRRPNVIQTLLAGALACSPSLALPPHLVRYLGKTYNSHHTAIELLQNVIEEHRDDDAIRESGLDALAETYAELSEEDPLYGLWRRRAFFSETNISLSFEQAGLWSQAQQMYEAAQLKARSGTLPFTESEYTLWEDHWINCAEKLQQWDILTDLARQEGNNDLLLECAWRLQDWANDKAQIQDAIQNMLPAPTPRKRVFEALMLLIRSQTGEQINPADFQRVCDEGIQYSLRKWYHLPEIVSESHIPLLHIFQQWVELQEAAKQIFVSLSTTDASNLDQRSQEMKSTLQTWRDRLPNLWDNVNIWSDLVSWRQHIFGAINRAYMPLIPPVGPNAAAASANSHAYRGYHETAWIVNRFAHVARKHHLSEVCINSLNKIYTLPNIEIQEAFLKLREQAKCHYQTQNELTTGLEVINNTNLGYFNSQQKSEFFTLKGMFLARLGMNDEADQVFGQAITLDMTFPKVWAEYGRYHDRLFKAEPNNLNRATQAVVAYLQAAGLYKSGKVRKILVRILWLLSLDDATGTVSKAFDAYTGELPVWYWITFAPQLIGALASREAKYARIILMQIAKKYPQGLFFHLRVARAEFAMAQKQQRDQEAKAAAAAAKAAAANGQQASQASADGTDAPTASNGSAEHNGQSQGSEQNGSQSSQPPKERTPLEYVEDVASSLKTAFPLLALSVELVCDQICTRFKAVPDEDMFRLITALLQDGMQQYVNRAVIPSDNGLLPRVTQTNIGRFAHGLPSHLKDAFHQDFVATSPNLYQYVQRLQIWRNRFEQILDRKPKRHPLENLSHWLVEYKYQTFDEIEVPGQYLKAEDNNRSFVKISYFAPKVEVGRFGGHFSRRLIMVGHDGSNHTFAVQQPLPRGSRREEKMSQFFRMLNGPLNNRVESRKRNLQFNLPAIVHVGQLCRLVESDTSVTTLQDIYERYCQEVGMDKDDPIMAYVTKLRETLSGLPKITPALNDLPCTAAKLEVYIEIASKMFPDTILRDYFIRSTNSAGDLWHTRKQVTIDLAAFFFQTYIMCISRRLPSKLLFSRADGQFHTAELVPDHHTKRPEFLNDQPVPFRLTPNIQNFVTPIGIEGLLVTSVATIARALTESEYDLEHKLAIFVSDEMQFWHSSRKMPRPAENQLRDMTLNQVNEIVRRATLLSCKMEREKTPIGGTVVNQAVLDLVIHATNPIRLASLDVTSMPWL